MEREQVMNSNDIKVGKNALMYYIPLLYTHNIIIIII